MMMMRRSCSLLVLLISCSRWWGASCSSRLDPPKCDATVTFSSQISTSKGTDSIHSRSLSPWRWRSTTVKNRIPSTLWEAQCISSSSSGTRLGQTEVQDLNSVPIYRNILVLTRQDNSRCYTASFQSVAVGCTSVRATTRHS